MTQYEVVIRDMETEGRWTLMFQADDFAHAEEQAIQFLDEVYNEIIEIRKDYDTDG
jgi:hypothetical protein